MVHFQRHRSACHQRHVFDLPGLHTSDVRPLFRAFLTPPTESSVAWHATEFQLAEAIVQGQSGKRSAFRLARSDHGGIAHTLTDLPRTVVAHQLQAASTARTGRWRLPPHGGRRLPCSCAHDCPQRSSSGADHRSSPRPGLSCGPARMLEADPSRSSLRWTCRRSAHRRGSASAGKAGGWGMLWDQSSDHCPVVVEL